MRSRCCDRCFAWSGGVVAKVRDLVPRPRPRPVARAGDVVFAEVGRVENRRASG